MVVLSYVLLTEHVIRLHRWSSLKTYMILSMIEFVFWVAAMALSCLGVANGCSGAGCTYSGLLIAVSLILMYVKWYNDDECYYTLLMNYMSSLPLQLSFITYGLYLHTSILPQKTTWFSSQRETLVSFRLYVIRRSDAYSTLSQDVKVFTVF